MNQQQYFNWSDYRNGVICADVAQVNNADYMKEYRQGHPDKRRTKVKAVSQLMQEIRTTKTNHQCQR